MKARILLAVLLVVSLLASCAPPTPTPTPQPTATPTPRPTATPAPTATPQPTATHTAMPTPTPLPPPPPEPTKKPEPTNTPEVKPTWVVPISNAEAKYDPDNQAWRYYSTNEGEKGQYVVSVRQNDKGEYEFYNFAEKIAPQLHPEVFVKSTWAQMATRMRETGAVKALFCDIGLVSNLEVLRYTDKKVPAGLKVSFRGYPVTINYPYLKEGRANPGIPLDAILLDGINSDITRSIKFKTYDGSGNLRTMKPEEVWVGQYGEIVNFGDSLIEIDSGQVLLLGRDIEDKYNRVLLDSFVRDENGRLMHP